MEDDDNTTTADKEVLTDLRQFAGWTPALDVKLTKAARRGELWVVYGQVFRECLERRLNLSEEAFLALIEERLDGGAEPSGAPVRR